MGASDAVRLKQEKLQEREIELSVDSVVVAGRGQVQHDACDNEAPQTGVFKND